MLGLLEAWWIDSGGETRDGENGDVVVLTEETAASVACLASVGGDCRVVRSFEDFGGGVGASRRPSGKGGDRRC